MKSTFALIEDIVAELEKGFTGMMYDTKAGSVSPNIFIGHVPPKKSMPAGIETPSAVGDPPFALVRYLDDEDKNDSTTKSRVLESRIGILCCVYSKDSYEEIKTGYMDILNMADRVLLTLFNKRFWGDKRWFLGEESVKRTVGLEKELGTIYEAGAHDHPFYGAAVVATFKAAAIARSVI